MVLSGTSLTFTVQGNIQFAWWGETGAAAIRAAVLNTLSSAPLYFTVTDLTIDTPTLLDAAASGTWFTTPYRASITLTTYGNYGAVGDVQRIVANAFYQATGNVPSVSAGAQAAAVTTTGTTLAGIGQGLLGALTSQELLIIGGVLVLAAILASGKNVGALARAVRP